MLRMDQLQQIFLMMTFLILVYGTSVKMPYKQTQSLCLLDNLVYLTTKARSRIECAAICENNRYGPCSRYVYDGVGKICRLHSENVYPNTVQVSVQTQQSWLSYGIAHPQCSKPGYDFIPSTNKCIRHVYQTEKSYKNARVFCQAEGGDLLSFPTLNMWQFLQNYMKCVTKFWAGLRGYPTKRWVSGEVFSNIYGMSITWNNVPDSEFLADPEYDCGLFTVNNSPHLVDVSCNQKTKPNFVCEITI